jgi:hypothetical protein
VVTIATEWHVGQEGGGAEVWAEPGADPGKSFNATLRDRLWRARVDRVTQLSKADAIKYGT